MTELPSTPPTLSAANLEALTLEERILLFSRALTGPQAQALHEMLPADLVTESRILQVAAEMSAHAPDEAATPTDLRFQAAERVDRQQELGLPLSNELQWRTGQHDRIDIDIPRLMAQLPAEPLTDLLAALPAEQQDRLRAALATHLAEHTLP